MITYCVKCRKNTENLDSKIYKTKNGRIIMQSKCVVCEIKKSWFVKEQEAKGLLSNLKIKTPLNKVPLLGDTLFWVYKNEWNCEQIFTGRWKIYARNAFKITGFTYSACGLFTKNKDRIEKFMQTGNTDFINKNDLDKLKNLGKRTQSDKVLRDKAFEIASNPKYDGYQRGLAIYNHIQ